jgi:hypothetical protein
VVIGAACLPELTIAGPGALTGPAVCGDGILEPDAGEQCDPGSSADGGIAPNGGCSSNCTIVCDGGITPFLDPTTNHCYFGGASKTTLDGAVCEEQGAHLVRFVDSKEYAFVSMNAPTRFWVGIRATGKAPESWLPAEATPEPGWDPGCTGCFAAVDAGLTVIKGNCFTGSPSEPPSSPPPWTQTTCVDPSEYYPQCEREPPGSRVFACPAGSCFTVKATPKRYVLVPGSTGTGNAQLGANDALQACAHLGGRLVVFDSPEEREQVAYELASRATDFWLGLAPGPDGGWAWDTEGGLSPLPWGEGQPVATPSGVERAYAYISPGAVDSELARVGNAADGGDSHSVVCEM